MADATIDEEVVAEETVATVASGREGYAADIIAFPSLLDPSDAAPEAFVAENSGTGALFLNGDRGGRFLVVNTPAFRPLPPASVPVVPPRALRKPR